LLRLVKSGAVNVVGVLELHLPHKALELVRLST
jgi:hypothetical protein